MFQDPQENRTSTCNSTCDNARNRHHDPHSTTKAGRVAGDQELDLIHHLTQHTMMCIQATLHGYPPSADEVRQGIEQIIGGTTAHKEGKASSFLPLQPIPQHKTAYHGSPASAQNGHQGECQGHHHDLQIDLIDQYIDEMNWKVNENSNMAFSLQGLNNFLSSDASQTYWLRKIYSDDIRAAHQNGNFHIHDLNLLSVYCVGWDLMDLLVEGFKGVAGKVESKPPKHFRSALGQAVNFFYTLQGESAGAQAFSSFDTLLAPFIYYDGLSYREIKQALQEFIFNINVPTRVGFQTPFTNVTLDLTVPDHYADQPVIIGGRPQEKTYRAFQHEMNLFNKALMEVMMEGDAKGRVFSFPIPTINITPTFDWDNPVLDALWESTAKYGVPYFSNFINSDLSPEDTRSMCCRLRLDTKQLEKRGGGLFGASPLTGSIGVVTINMPRLGYLATTEEDFLQRLESLMELAKKSLEQKRAILEILTERGLYPYTKFYLRSVKERFGHYWQNHFSTIGLVGMHEACLNLLGEGIGSDRGLAFANRVLDVMRDKLLAFQEETGNNYNLEATPAEGTSYRLARKDVAQFRDIRLDEHTRGEPFYTNSTQLPVHFSDDLFEVLDRQDELQTKYTGGTVIHLFAGERIQDIETVKTLVHTICSTYHLPYFTFTPTFSICPEHGYLEGEQATCPTCGQESEIYSRVVGYLRPVNQWNKGKRAEFEARKTFEIAQMNQMNQINQTNQMNQTAHIDVVPEAVEA